MRRVTLSAVVWLTALWVMLWNDLSIANVASGLILSVVLLAANRLPFAAGATSGNDDRLRISPLHFAYFIVYVVVQLIRSNLSLARKILTRTNTVNAGVIAVPMRTCGEMTMLVMSNVITLTPGTITIEAKGLPQCCTLTFFTSTMPNEYVTNCTNSSRYACGPSVPARRSPTS